MVKHYTRAQNDSIADAARIDDYSRCYAATIRNEISASRTTSETSERSVVHLLHSNGDKQNQDRAWTLCAFRVVSKPQRMKRMKV